MIMINENTITTINNNENDNDDDDYDHNNNIDFSAGLIASEYACLLEVNYAKPMVLFSGFY